MGSTASGEQSKSSDKAMSVRHAALWSVGGQYIGFALQFASSVIISRFFLDPAEIGLFSIALAAAMLVSLLQDFGLTRYIANLPSLAGGELGRCSSVAMLFALVIGSFLALGAAPMADFYGEAGLAPILWIIAGSYLFVPLAIVPVAVLSREMAFRDMFFVNFAGAITQAGFAIGLAAMGFSAASLAWAMVAAAIVKGMAAQWRKPALPFPLRLDGLKPVLRFGSQSSALYMIGGIGYRSADLIVGALLSLTATGLFTRATGLAMQLRNLISGGASAVLYPALARLQREGEELGKPYLRVVSCFTAATWPAMAGLALAASPTINLLFGEKWLGSAPILMWIALGEMLVIALPLHIELPILRGAMKPLIFRNSLDTAASLALLFYGASFSAEGAAMSRVGYGLIWLCIYTRFTCHMAGIRPAQLLPVHLTSGFATLAAILPMGMARLWLPGFDQLGFIPLLLLAGAGVLLWLGALFAMRHPLSKEIAHMAADAAANLRRDKVRPAI